MKNLIEFKGKNTSWYKYLNLLQQEHKIYVMDNHNAALWCWMQRIDLSRKYNILHIDKHFDTGASHIEDWLMSIPKSIKEMSIEEYLDLRYINQNTRKETEVMRWDNYFPIFHHICIDNINCYHFFTHRDGTMYDKMVSKLDEYPIPGLFNLTNYLFDVEFTGNYNWIVNIDLDYFYQKIDDTDLTIKFISDEAIEFFMNQLKKYLDNRIDVLTIALSPECCGGWNNSLNLMHFISKALGIDFNIN